MKTGLRILAEIGFDKIIFIYLRLYSRFENIFKIYCGIFIFIMKILTENSKQQKMLSGLQKKICILIRDRQSEFFLNEIILVVLRWTYFKPCRLRWSNPFFTKSIVFFLTLSFENFWKCRIRLTLKLCLSKLNTASFIWIKHFHKIRIDVE